jgi:ABC-2 type transport system permease protein
MTGRSRELHRCSRRLVWAFAAELAKLRTLPAVAATALGTVAAAAVLTVFLVAATDTGGGDEVAIVLETVQILQIGTILIGVLAAASEYAGSQIRTTLIAVPNRALAFAAKAVAYVVVATTTSETAVAVALGTALISGGSPAVSPGWSVLGAAGYLVVMGLLAHTLAVVFRSLIAPLAGTLAVVLIASPVLHGLSEHARWLPDQAGRLLYLPDTDPVLAPGSAALVLLAWTAVLTAAALTALTMRDA